MRLRPFLAAYIAKLITTPARHMVTALILLYHKSTSFALTIMHTALKMSKLILVAGVLMSLKKTVATKLCLAYLAFH